MTIPRILNAITLVAFCMLPARADEKLKDIACRSVHLVYSGEQATAYYNEVKVLESAPGTFFMTNGFNAGYYGIQESARKTKVLIFSIWDPGSKEQDPKKVAEEERVKLLYKHDAVRIGRFGNEGTGGQSFYDYDWKLGETYRFLVTTKVEGEFTEFTNWFYHPEQKEWLKLVTFARKNQGKQLSGFNSFVEDFRRNRESTKFTRRAEYGPAWIKTLGGEWQQLTTAKFTGDANPVVNIDSGMVDEQRFFLATGGEIENKTVKLRDNMTLAKPTAAKPQLPIE
jgi:hypothetical protein